MYLHIIQTRGASYRLIGIDKAPLPPGEESPLTGQGEKR